MNWQNAKNLTLIFLIVLNAFLGVLVYANRTDYRLSADAANAIEKLLGENRIALNTDIPGEFKPLSQLNMNPGSYDTNTILQIFFSNPQDAKITLEYDKTIYKTETETLVLQNDSITYTLNSPADMYVLNAETARELCDAFLEKNKSHLSNFFYDRCVPTDKGFSVEYRQSYKSSIVYSNFFVFDVTENGIVKIRYKYDRTGSFERNAKEIISPDRALFILMKYINSEYESKDVSVDSLDIVYIQSETSSNVDASLKASPYYRIYYSESDRPFLINAYTGVIFDYAM